jgi:hypothetical protein
MTAAPRPPRPRLCQLALTDLCLAALLALVLSVAQAAAQQDAGVAGPDAGIVLREIGAPQATLTCERAAAPGRVRCEVEARVAAGDSISWGDVVLERVPPFAIALRGRIGPHDASIREPGLWRWPFALVARGRGAGLVEGQMRVIVCADKACAAREVPVVGEVDVGL